jgi:hypothetical protein
LRVVRYTNLIQSAPEGILPDLLPAEAHSDHPTSRRVLARSARHWEVNVEQVALLALIPCRVYLGDRLRDPDLLRLDLLDPVAQLVVVPILDDRRQEDAVEGMLGQESRRLSRA